jgi:hypothetical protein
MQKGSEGGKGEKGGGKGRNASRTGLLLDIPVKHEVAAFAVEGQDGS